MIVKQKVFSFVSIHSVGYPYRIAQYLAAVHENQTNVFIFFYFFFS